MGATPARQRRELEATAYHEAGHAAASIILGRGLRSVTIIPDAADRSLGSCHGTAYPAWFQPDVMQAEGRSRAWVEREVMIYFAGGIAEARFKGHRRRLGQASDLLWAVEFASTVCGSLEETEALLNWLHIRTENLIGAEPHWTGLDAIARALLDRKRLSGREARRAYNEAVQAALQSE